jgi:hypothetical protein
MTPLSRKQYLAVSHTSFDLLWSTWRTRNRSSTVFFHQIASNIPPHAFGWSHNVERVRKAPQQALQHVVLRHFGGRCHGGDGRRRCGQARGCYLCLAIHCSAGAGRSYRCVLLAHRNVFTEEILRSFKYPLRFHTFISSCHNKWISGSSPARRQLWPSRRRPHRIPSSSNNSTTPPQPQPPVPSPLSSSLVCVSRSIAMVLQHDWIVS